MTEAPTNSRVLVDAKTIASHLKITDTTVYALVRGVRGFKKIEPLPMEREGSAMMFDLEAVEAWKVRTGFKPSKQGRRKVHRVIRERRGQEA